MEGNTARGASSPAKPALHMPEPLSQTKAVTSSSHIFVGSLVDFSHRHRGTMLTQLSPSSTAPRLLIGVPAYRLLGGGPRAESRLPCYFRFCPKDAAAE